MTAALVQAGAMNGSALPASIAALKKINPSADALSDRGLTWNKSADTGHYSLEV